MVFSFSHILILFILFSLQVFEFSECATMVVDGVSVWKNPHLQIGDSVIFQHKYGYSLYIFKNQQAFSLCNFTKASILTTPSSSIYTWHTSRPGVFYFSFYNGSNQPCLQGQKLAVKVTSSSPPPAAAPLPSTSPPPTSGGFVASSPAFPWPFQPRSGAAASPSPAPAQSGGAESPVAPEKEGIPFINSNPAVPLPTGEVDSATIRPLPTSGYQHPNHMLGSPGVGSAMSCAMLLVLLMMMM